MNDMTNEQLRAWAVEKVKNNGEWYTLLETPALYINFEINLHGICFVDFNNRMGGVVVSEYDDEEYFYSALRIAYCCKEISGNGDK